MQNHGKHSRPDQGYGQQANRPADMGRQAPARPQQPYDQQGYQRPPYQQPRYAQQPGQPNRKAFMAIHTEGGTSISSRFRTITSTTA